MAHFVVTLIKDNHQNGLLTALGKHATNDLLFFVPDKGYGDDKVCNPRTTQIIHINMLDAAVERLKRDELTEDEIKALTASLERHLFRITESGWYKIYGSQGYFVGHVERLA